MSDRDEGATPESDAAQAARAALLHKEYVAGEIGCFSCDAWHACACGCGYGYCHEIDATTWERSICASYYEG